MRRRWLVLPLTLLVAAAVVELSARALNLDARQGEATLLAHGRVDRGPWASGAAIGVDYLPHPFEQDEAGFTTRWGRCDYGHPGPSLLVLGDSTTRRLAQGAQRDPPELSWPRLLAAELPENVQLCVLAEDGYDPTDLAALHAAFAPRLQPTLTLALLCANDLTDRPARTLKTDARGLAIYNPAAQQLSWPPLYWAPAFQASEALRFVHWRVATATASGAPVPGGQPLTRQPAEALARLQSAPGELLVAYLPELISGLPPGNPRLEQLARSSGVPISALQLPAPLPALRIDPADPLHINAAGHRGVADALVMELPSALRSTTP